jgi:hypothetical protein
MDKNKLQLILWVLVLCFFGGIFINELVAVPSDMGIDFIAVVLSAFGILGTIGLIILLTHDKAKN